MKDQKDQQQDNQFVEKVYFTPKKNKNQQGRLSTQAFFCSHSSSKQYQRFDLSQSKPHQNIKQFKQKIHVQSNYSKSNESNGYQATVKMQYSPLKHNSQLQIYQFTSGVFKKEQNEKTFQNEQLSYGEIVQKISNGQIYEVQKPRVFKNKSGFKYSKLVTFILNTKNSKVLVFDQIRRTLKAIYRCQHCKNQFKNAAALGGHISKCSKNVFKQPNSNKIIKKRERTNIILTKQEDYSQNDSDSLIVVQQCSDQNQELIQIKSELICQAKINEPKGYNLREKEKINYYLRQKQEK